jgi:hypothetical protein
MINDELVIYPSIDVPFIINAFLRSSKKSKIDEESSMARKQVLLAVQGNFKIW